MTEPRPQPDTWSRRFPALGRLGRNKGRIPFVQAMAGTECGAACLTMVLAYHGKSVPLSEVREVMGIRRDGATARTIVHAARWHGLRARGVSLDVDQLAYLPPASILHWGFNHFVVLERMHRHGADIVDPGFGRRRVPMDELRRQFTGVALVLEPGEGFTPHRARGSRLWRHLRHILAQTGHLPRILVTSLLLQLFALAVPVLTGVLVDRIVPRGDHRLLLVMLGGLGALVIFFFLASLIRAHLLLQLRTLLDARMTLGFLEHLVALPFAFFQQRSTGDLMARVSSNATIREIFTAGALSGLLDGTLVSLYLLLLLWASPGMGLLVLVLALAQVAVAILSWRRQRELMGQNLHIQARADSHLVEMLAGIETLKTMGSEQRSVEHWTDLFVDVLNVSIDRGRLNALVDSLNGTLRLASPLAVLAYGTFLVLDGQLSLGTMLALQALAMGFFLPLSDLMTTVIQLQLLGSYIERIDDVLQTEPEQDHTRALPAPRPSGRIALEHASFRYGPLAPMVVQDVSLTVEPGQLVALVGRSGSGKSTLARLLVGLYLPVAGRVLYDGMDLAQLDLRTLRGQLGMVPQHPYLFGTTIRANIALADPTLPLERIEAAARAACIHDDIAAMPMGYDTPLIDAGASLSGGQRQRLALARALVLDPPILVLDEATSALDAVTEARVQESLAGLRGTRIVIAHRLSTVVHADCILVMEDGRLVEQGSHAALLARGGVYAGLVAAQLGADA